MENKYSTEELLKNSPIVAAIAARKYIPPPLHELKTKDMEENKYYTPDIEDIRVGYECEMSLDTKNKNWRPVCLREKDFKPFSWYDHHDERPTYRDVLFRTPYLTKEQIEGEGWMFVNHENTPFNSGYRKGIYRIQTVNNGSMGMYISRRDEKGINCIFEGIITSINEFRYICKLLKIN